MRLQSIVGLASVAAMFAACGGGSSDSGFGSDGDGGTDGDGGIGVGDGGFGTDAHFGSGDGGATTQLGCSPDLQNVVDANGAIVQVCAPAQGCANGMCTDACTAAATSKGSVGCDFQVATPDFQNQIKPPCFAVFLANNWPRPVKITASRGGQMLDATTFARIPQPGQPETSWMTVPATGIPSGSVAVLFMSSDPNSVNGTPMKCPVPDAINASTAITDASGAGTTGRGQAFHIVTDTPVSAYDIHPYGGAKSYLPSAELLLPTSAWGTNYVAALPKPGDYMNGSVADGPQWVQIVGSVDNTTVKFVPTVALPGGMNVPAAAANTVATFTVNAGEIIQWQNPWSTSSGPTLELSGSIISSDHPVAFIGGNGYLCLRSPTNVSMFGGYGGCDSGHQQIPPISALPSEYAVAPYATRRMDLQEETIPYRIVGAVDGTTLAYDPPVTGAPATLKLGQVADFFGTGPFVVKSQDASHPFYIGQMMTGSSVVSGSRPGASGTLGDEEYVNVPAPAQYLQKYVFFTDPTYPTTNLVITRKKNQQGSFSDVNVDCLGNVTGWKPVGSGGQYETTNVDLLRMGSTTQCQNGGHTAKSDGPFGLVVWGLDTDASYAYPAGGNVATINSVVVPPMPR